MTEIDYTALSNQTKLTPMSCRAVVVALREQGLVVVQNRDILTMYQAVGVGIFLLDAERVAIDRLRSSAEPALPRLHNDAALAAPGEGKEESNGSRTN